MFKLSSGKIIPIIIIGTLMSGCVSASSHREDVQDDTGERISVGTVQRSITVGMSSAQVIEVLGSPNIVSTDDQRRENWVYDKVASDVTYSNSKSGIGALILGQNAGSASRSQRTLTIIIKFDGNHKVRDYSYHTSKF